jgi:hypothetical protein
MGSIAAGFHMQEMSLSRAGDMKVARLEEKTTSAEMSMTRMDRKMLQLEYHIKAKATQVSSMHCDLCSLNYCSHCFELCRVSLL